MNNEKGNYNKDGNYIPLNSACDACDGTSFHLGKDCGACDGTGKKKVQLQLDKVYRAKNDLPIRQPSKNKLLKQQI